MGGSDHKFYLDFPQSGGFAPVTPTLFKDQLQVKKLHSKQKIENLNFISF